MRTLSMCTALTLLVTVGCISQGHWDDLAKQDQDRFLRCRHAMQPNLCGGDNDMVYVTGCIRGAEATYSDQPTALSRRQWLIEQGCPPSMVNPAPYASTEPPDAPMPRRKPAPEPAAAPVSDDGEVPH